MLEEATVDREFDPVIREARADPENRTVSGPSSGWVLPGIGSKVHTLDVNTQGGYRAVKHDVPHLRESDHGRIINI